MKGTKIGLIKVPAILPQKIAQNRGKNKSIKDGHH